MGIFDAFSGKKNGCAFNKATVKKWREVYSSVLGRTIAIQYNADKYAIKGDRWDVDFSQGCIWFGDVSYPIQFIGSESFVSNTWLWGWENINGFSQELLYIAEQTLSWGNRLNLAPLKTAEFKMDSIFNGHSLATVACGINGSNCFYYRCPHSQGAAYVAVDNAPKEVFQPVNIADFVKITTECLKGYDIDHKVFLEGFLYWNKTEYDWSGNTLIAHFDQDLYFRFDGENDSLRITEITT